MRMFEGDCPPPYGRDNYHHHHHRTHSGTPLDRLEAHHAPHFKH